MCLGGFVSRYQLVFYRKEKAGVSRLDKQCYLTEQPMEEKTCHGTQGVVSEKKGTEKVGNHQKEGKKTTWCRTKTKGIRQKEAGGLKKKGHARGSQKKRITMTLKRYPRHGKTSSGVRPLGLRGGNLLIRNECPQVRPSNV